MRPIITIIAACLLLAVVAMPAAAATLAEKKAEVQRIERELAALDAQAGAAASAANTAIDAADEIRRELTATRRELAQSKRDLAEGRRRLGERLRNLYANPEPTLPRLLVSGGGVSDIIETQRLLDQAARSDTRVVQRVRARRADLATLTTALAGQSVEAERRATDAKQARDRVQRLVAARREVLGGARAELKRLLAEERARQARLAALKLRENESVPVSAASAPAIPLPGGSHVFPVAGPTRFTDDWLYSRPGGRYHEGIDLFAERGTPLVAVADGTVYRVGWNTLGGWRFWLRDTGGTTYYYAHLESFAAAAREGATVSRGTVLGYMGDSGSARGTGVHLHFEIHPGGGGPVRPWPYVTSWPRVG